MTRIVPPEINDRRPGRVLLIGRDPGKDEVIEGRPFVGLAGQLLDSVLSELGLMREEVNIVNLVGKQPAENDFKNHDPADVAEGIKQAHEWARKLKPSLIITLGNEAAHTFIPDWPSSRKQGLTVYGAKSIEERRGYFWDTSFGTVLSALHPAGVLRKKLPGEWLLRQDFRRARAWLAGKLPRDNFPEVRRLRDRSAVRGLLSSELLGWDIETKWDNTALLCSGYCGDDFQPYVAVAPYEYEAYGEQILLDVVRKCGHNGPGLDVPAMRLFRGIHVQGYTDDTQQMWWALEPDIAGSEGAADEENEVTERRHMTRKGLAFLASIYFNLPWWKNYPDKEDPDYLPRMVRINSNDAFATRWLAACMLPEIEKAGVMGQYRQAMTLHTEVLVDLHLRGMRVNEELRQARHDALESRYKAAQGTSEAAGLSYIVQNDIEAFRKLKKCTCCGGGKSQKDHCWRCGGLPKKPKVKEDYSPNGKPNSHVKLADLKAALPPCKECGATGKIKTYHFNPYSQDQMKKFLNHIGAPRTEFKKKQKTDAQALKKVIRWAKG